MKRLLAIVALLGFAAAGVWWFRERDQEGVARIDAEMRREDAEQDRLRAREDRRTREFLIRGLSHGVVRPRNQRHADDLADRLEALEDAVQELKDDR